MDAVARNSRVLGGNGALLIATLPGRIAVLAALFCLEKFALNFLVDFDAVPAAQGLGHFVRLAQHHLLRFAVTLAIMLAVFCYVRPSSIQSRPLTAGAAGRLNLQWLIAHAVFFVPLLPLSYALYRNEQFHLPFALVTGLWLLFGTMSVAAAFRAMAPWKRWWGDARSLGELWLYASIVAAAATAAMDWAQTWWTPTAKLTFILVTRVLLPFIPTLEVDPIELTLSTERFAVQIADECSGLEGLGLMLVFSSAWLLLFRREYRFPRALVLIPIGLALVFALNVLRIAVLVLIGDAGHAAIAIFGFHSQAGWIAFNGAAVGLVLVSRRIAWLNRRAPMDRQASSNPTAAYLMPFLAVLIAGTLAHAMSGGFETLYPMRLLAGLAALAWYRKSLSDLDYRFTWRGPLAGLMVFLIWSAAAHFVLRADAMPSALAALPTPWRNGWIACRAVAAIVTVPIVEELAYRGFLLRRWLSADFESVAFSAVRLPQLFLTALMFGLVHGSMWWPGVIAGVFYGAVLIRTGRIGESIAAHATTNALIAACVVIGGQWQLW